MAQVAIFLPTARDEALIDKAYDKFGATDFTYTGFNPWPNKSVVIFTFPDMGHVAKFIGDKSFAKFASITAEDKLSHEQIDTFNK